MKKKLLKQVGMDELQQMRADGLTNQEIADRLEVSYATIYNHLGKQPKGMRAYRNCHQTVENDRQEPICTDRLSISERRYRGVYVDFVVGDVTVTITNGEESIILPMDAFNDFVKDTIALSQIVRQGV